MVLSVTAKIDPQARAASADGFRKLCAFVVNAMRAPLPEHVQRRATLVLMDDIGAMVAASGEPEVVQAQGKFRATSAATESTVFAKGAPRLDRFSAAAANGMAATWCELDEGYRAAPCHAGAYLLPALLAEAEASGASVETVLRATALAYELTARFARAFPFATMTVHPHAAYATVGAAAAIGLLRGLEADMFLDAVAGACSMTFAGPYNHAIDGALARNAWTSAGAWIGLRSVEWALAGISGIPETPYDVYSGCFATECLPLELTAGLGENWAIAGGYHKIFACCQYAHSMIEASLVLHQRLGPSARDNVESIVVETHPRGMTLTGVNPATTLAAKFSMPHAAASVACLASGGQAAFAKSTLTDESISALRHKVRLETYADLQPWPNDRPARVTWTMRDGSAHSATCVNARGGADQPFDEATLIEKLNENTCAVFPRMAGQLAGLLSGTGKGHDTWAAFTARMVEVE